MSQLSLKNLQNGSDIRGVAFESVEDEVVTLTPHVAYCIGVAFAEEVAKMTGRKTDALTIAVGRDCRITGPDLMNAIAAGAHSAGAQILDCGLASTPAMFMSCVFPETDCDGACMVTASHLPFNRNGFKFFTKKGGFEKADITSVLTRTEQLLGATSQPTDLLSLYAAKLCDMIKEGVNADDYDHPLAGLKIVVDASNGNGGFFAFKVLAPLGADISG
ncbi:MAG: phosphomannomutase/phosphoglucomutase, partial [Lachnospiraceae bacterium]|nr:phosphomannomutase/phosphoglucomutase [Lachnospiraceae bacterium]